MVVAGVSRLHDGDAVDGEISRMGGLPSCSPARWAISAWGRPSACRELTDLHAGHGGFAEEPVNAAQRVDQAEGVVAAQRP